MSDLDDLVVEADPARGVDPSTSTAARVDLFNLIRSSSPPQALRTRRWWTRPRVLIPIGIGALLSVTGAAVALPLLDLQVNGQEVELDVEIPITYTTKTGVSVVCSYGLYVGDPSKRTAADEALATFLREHDWQGIGQRIYEQAISHPYVPGATDEWESDTQQLRDQFSWSDAQNTVIFEQEIPSNLLPDGLSTGGPSNCSGQLR